MKDIQRLLKMGDFLLTRNAGNDKDVNTTPGYFNHMAVYIGNNAVVEAQREPGSVIRSWADEFWARYPTALVLRVTKNSDYYGPLIAKRADSLYGSKYRKIISIWKRLRKDRRGDNCTTVGRKAYAYAFGYDPMWRIPDESLREIKFNNLKIVLEKGVDWNEIS